MDALIDPGVTPSHAPLLLVLFVLICTALLAWSEKAVVNNREVTALFILTLLPICHVPVCGVEESRL